MSKGGGEPGGFSDQYGEAMKSQDRGEFHGPGGRGAGGMTGGGEAGGGRRSLDLSGPVFPSSIPQCDVCAATHSKQDLHANCMVTLLQC